ncbi:MAG: hypothetical protein A2V63_11435 [Candidatus Eisenbacteria bacterium RBG_19FT_COMBO_70_11]|nr:MAG: hypothetical protein A2V63_11435 [Candidatus Eisenbacteria bacterium RBG_19FT_COMBO_70_11]
MMKTMSLSLRASLIPGSSSSAARRPTDGSPPAPRPRVELSPIWIRWGASDWLSACMSVLATMNSTPRRPAPIMRLTALPPAPPHPMTLSFADEVVSISSSNMAPLPVPSPADPRRRPFRRPRDALQG